MIEPLPPGSLPLPSTSAPQDALARVPAFLPWAMPQRQASPPAPSACPPLAQPACPPTASTPYPPSPTPVQSVLQPAPSMPPAAPPPSTPSLPISEGLGGLPSMSPWRPGVATLPREVPPSPIALGASVAPPVPPTHAPPAHVEATIGDCLPMPPTAASAEAVGPTPLAATASPAESTAISVEVEAHLLDPRGGREIVIVPMRLRATGHLAQSADARSWSPVGDGAMASAPSIPTPMPRPVVPRPSVAGAPALHPRALEGETGALPPWISAFRADDAGVEEDTSSRSPTTAAETANWLMRRLALVQQAGRAPTLWLRDYRLDPDEAFRVAADLHRLARDRGVALDRIVVNGREHRPDPGAPVRAEPQE